MLFQSMFYQATAIVPPEHWAKCGVRLSSSGVALMAHLWPKSVLGNWTIKNACCHCSASCLVGSLQMQVGKVEVLFPVEVGDIVFSCSDVVANVVANRLINFWLLGYANAF